MWNKISDFFLRSETILVARLQTFAGIALGAFLALDPSLFEAYVPSKWVPVYLLAIGIVTEYARRRNDPNIGKGP